jgi:hypothetical protein
LIAAKNVKKMKAIRSGSVSLMGIPVSKPNCARGPFPVRASPISEKANPSYATLPTKSSFSFVKPNDFTPKNSLGLAKETLGFYRDPAWRSEKSSSGTNLPDAGNTAAIKLKTAKIAINPSISDKLLTPVSNPNYPAAPFPVKISPTKDAANPSMAIRPTNSSLPLVKPNSMVPMLLSPPRPTLNFYALTALLA